MPQHVSHREAILRPCDISLCDHTNIEDQYGTARYEEGLGQLEFLLSTFDIPRYDGSPEHLPDFVDLLCSLGSSSCQYIEFKYLLEDSCTHEVYDHILEHVCPRDEHGMLCMYGDYTLADFIADMHDAFGYSQAELMRQYQLLRLEVGPCGSYRISEWCARSLQLMGDLGCEDDNALHMEVASKLLHDNPSLEQALGPIMRTLLTTHHGMTYPSLQELCLDIEFCVDAWQLGTRPERVPQFSPSLGPEPRQALPHLNGNRCTAMSAGARQAIDPRCSTSVDPDPCAHADCSQPAGSGILGFCDEAVHAFRSYGHAVKAFRASGHGFQDARLAKQHAHAFLQRMHNMDMQRLPRRVMDVYFELCKRSAQLNTLRACSWCISGGEV